ncbi:hypothetical protein BN440_pEA290015 (plasmid) [Erwinia amylovora MR1]|nr:hypothetical protein BN440_pEA290015 [Erwinia amylovora MR1]
MARLCGMVTLTLHKPQTLSKVCAIHTDLPDTTMTTHSSKDPLHGVTLEALLTMLVARFGWQQLAERININCFKSDPSIKSSLKFLRRTPWARKEVEDLYIASLKDNHSAKPEMPTDNPWNSRQRKD